MNSSSLKKIPEMHIDPEGGNKYILCEVFNKKEKKLVVRGDESAKFYLDILKRLKEDMVKIGLDVKYSGNGLGGGKISVVQESKIIILWSKSKALGKADHEITAKIIKKYFPSFKIIIENGDEDKDDEE